MMMMKLKKRYITVPLEVVTRHESIIASRTLHKFLMQIEKTTPEIFDAIRKIRDELQRDSNFKKKQTMRCNNMYIYIYIYALNC